LLCSKTTELMNEGGTAVGENTPPSDAQKLSKALFEARMESREAARIQQKEKVIRNDTSTSNESTLLFGQSMKQHNDEAVAILAGAAKVEKELLMSSFDKCAVVLQNMRHLLSEATVFLPLYEIRNAQQMIDYLEQQQKHAKDSLLPRKKFTFSKSAREHLQSREIKPGTLPQLLPNLGNLDTTPIASSSKFENQISNTLYILPENEKIAEINDFSLSSLSKCTVYMLQKLDALRITQLSDCIVVCGPVNGSIFIENCSNCTFALVSQQIRLHTTHHCSLYIHSRSHPIIEDCNSLHFAPYQGYIKWGRYCTLFNKLFDEYSFNNDQNCWENVDDFNWQKVGQHSPNWQIMAEEKRTSLQVPP